MVGLSRKIGHECLVELCVFACTPFLGEKLLGHVTNAVERVHFCLPKDELVVAVEVGLIQLNSSEPLY